MLVDLINSDKKALIDDADFELVKNYSWLLSALGYAITSRKGGLQVRFFMHRVIAKARQDEFVDHKNHDILDNTRANLRKCTHGQNMANRKMGTLNKLGVRGVRRREGRKNPYRAEVTKDGKTHSSSHLTIESASKWVRTKSIELHGEFACLDGCL